MAGAAMGAVLERVPQLQTDGAGGANYIDISTPFNDGEGERRRNEALVLRAAGQVLVDSIVEDMEGLFSEVRADLEAAPTKGERVANALHNIGGNFLEVVPDNPGDDPNPPLLQREKDGVFTRRQATARKLGAFTSSKSTIPRSALAS